MSRTEEAWNIINKKWYPSSPTEDAELTAVRQSLKRLSGFRLPVAAIDELTTLICKLDTYWKRTDNDARAFLEQNSSWIYRQLSDDIEKMRSVDQNWIEAALDVLGIEFNWQHSSQPFEEFVREMPVSEEIKAKFLERVGCKDKADEYLHAAYHLMRELQT